MGFLAPHHPWKKATQQKESERHISKDKPQKHKIKTLNSSAISSNQEMLNLYEHKSTNEATKTVPLT
jgi:hypothetical protein